MYTNLLNTEVTSDKNYWYLLIVKKNKEKIAKEILDIWSKKNNINITFFNPITEKGNKLSPGQIYFNIPSNSISDINNDLSLKNIMIGNIQKIDSNEFETFVNNINKIIIDKNKIVVGKDYKVKSGPFSGLEISITEVGNVISGNVNIFGRVTKVEVNKDNII